MTTNKNNPAIKVKQGFLKGQLNETKLGFNYFSFKGVPYAQPPLAHLRFKAPLSPKPWDGIYEAFEHGSVCLQADFLNQGALVGNENCLFLNVYTQNCNPMLKKPVMVFFHGGAFQSGSGNDDIYGPEFLLQHDIVLVTVNYRLEVLGFLCLDTPEIPGNAGMKDQVMSLRWVQDNISQFGGDPNNVTIFGESAGGASVTYHMLSSMSKGLFHKAIVQSGCCLCDWALGRDARQRAIRTAKYLGFDCDDPDAILEYFQKLPAESFCKVTSKTLTEKEKNSLIQVRFAPVVEKKFHNVQPFLDEDPINLILRGKINKVPLIIGYNSNEGLLLYFSMKKKTSLSSVKSLSLIPETMRDMLSNESARNFGERIKKFYSNNDDDSGFLRFASDAYFIYDICRFASLYAKFSQPVFLYKFSCDTELNLFKQMVGLGSERGACHADELFYLFSNIMSKTKCEENGDLMKYVSNITKLWTNFTKTGNPNNQNYLDVTWKPFSSLCNEYLDIGEHLKMTASSEVSRVNFWNNLYKEAKLPHIISSHL